MYVLPRATAVGVFAPAALPAFSAMPTPIPAIRRLPSSPSGCWPILDPSQISIDQELEWLPGLFSITMCCSMPSATPGVEALARHAKVRSLYRACDARPFLPFRASVPIEQPISSTIPLPLLPLLPASIATASATPIGLSRLRTGYQLLSLHLATFPPPATLAAGFGYGRLTILTRRASHPLDGEPYPGSRLLSLRP